MVCETCEPAFLDAGMTSFLTAFQAANFLMKMADGIEVIAADKPYMNGGPSAADIQVAANPPPFMPMRRRKRMPGDA